jgi:hypothetical protein
VPPEHSGIGSRAPAGFTIMLHDFGLSRRSRDLNLRAGRPGPL